MGQVSEIIRFSITGVFVIATDFGVYYLLIHLLPSAIAKAISFTCGGVVAYVLNKYWTFKQEQKSSSEVVRFIIANFIALGLNVAVNETILRINHEAVLLALVTATILTSIFTFVVFKFLVFK